MQRIVDDLIAAGAIGGSIIACLFALAMLVD